MSDADRSHQLPYDKPGGRSVPDVPPWEPIADWLARLPNVSCDEEHEDTREPQNATQNQIRKRYEKTAKAIAYDIAMVGGADD